jgi:hypothetical protein
MSEAEPWVRIGDGTDKEKEALIATFLLQVDRYPDIVLDVLANPDAARLKSPDTSLEPHWQATEAMSERETDTPRSVIHFERTLGRQAIFETVYHILNNSDHSKQLDFDEATWDHFSNAKNGLYTRVREERDDITFLAAIKKAHKEYIAMAKRDPDYNTLGFRILGLLKLYAAAEMRIKYGNQATSDSVSGSSLTNVA